MPCTIHPDGGLPIVFPLNPTIADVTSDEEQGSFKAIRGGNFPYHVGYNPESIQLNVELPDNRPSFPGLQNAWVDPQEYIHGLQSALRLANSRVYVDFPEANIGAWYLLKEIREHYEGGFADVQLTITLTEERRILILTTNDPVLAGAAMPLQPYTTEAAPPPPVPTQQTPNARAQGQAPGVGTTPDQTPTAGGVYIAQAGDTVTQIAQIAYGDSSPAHVAAIMIQNNLTDPGDVPAKRRIYIPREDQVAGIVASVGTTSAAGLPNDPSLTGPMGNPAQLVPGI